MKNNLYQINGNWYVCVITDGKRHRKSFGNNRYAAEAAVAELKKLRAVSNASKDWSGLESFLKPKSTITFAEAAAQYMSERQSLKPSTLRGYNEILKNRLLPAFGDKPLAEITESSIAAFQSELAKDVSPTRVNNIMGPLRYILKSCFKRKFMTENPASNVRTLTEAAPDIDPFEPEELDAIISASRPEYQTLFTCQAWTGARPNELLALRWQDVDFKRDTIHIRRGRVRGKEGTPKTKSSNRVIPMYPLVKQLLTELQQRPTQHIDGYVFLSKHGKPIDKHLDYQWRIACKKAKVRHRPSYQLRHTYASISLAQGCDPGWLSKVLGHVSMQTLFKHYARFMSSAAKESENRMKEFLSSQRLVAHDKQNKTITA